MSANTKKVYLRDGERGEMMELKRRRVVVDTEIVRERQGKIEQGTNESK